MTSDGAFRMAWALALLAASMCVFVTEPRPASGPRTIVAVFGNEFRTPSNEAILDVLRGAFGSRPGEFELFSEYIDAARFEGPAHERRLAAFLRDRYSDRKIDLIFAADPPALRFLVRSRDQIAPRVPVVFSKILKSTLSSLRLPADFIGVADDVDATPTIRLALSLRPQANELVIVTGNDALGRLWETRLRDAAVALAPSMPYRVLSRMAIEDIERELASLSSRSVVLCGSFRRDGAGVFFPGSLYVLDRLAAVSSAPIFHIVPAAIGRGAVGSVSVPRHESAQQAVTIAKMILAGTSPESISPPAPIVPKAHLDWRQLRRWGVDEARLPADAIVLFRDRSIWDQYRYYVLAVLAVIFLQTALIAGLVFQQRLRRRAERDAAYQRKQLAHLSRATTLGSLSNSLAHELNQPLTAILANAQATRRLLAHEPVDLDEIARAVDDIVADDKRAGEIIASLRRMLVRADLPHQPLAMEALVLDALKLLKSEMLNRRTTVALEMDGNCPQVMGDQIQLQQVLVNLLMNASESMEGNSVSDRVVVVRVGPIDGGVRVSVEDRGCGAPPELVGGNFAPFTTTKDHGTGLGLTVCNAIIANHGSKLRVANNLARGAIFTFDLRACIRPTA
jgi:signal transduction histidine kinase